MNKDKAFTPFQLKNFQLRNRLGLAPMTRMSSLHDSVPRQDVLDFLVARARNGAALVYTEAIVTDYESSQGYPGQARMTTQRQIDTWRTVNQAIRAAGSLSIVQMFHCGRMAWPEVNPAVRSLGPSPIAIKQLNPLTGQPYPLPDEMSALDIRHVINGFVETAKGAVEAGFDGIEIHGAHGYLISQFLSAYSNQRSDDYGGTPAKRYRFAHEIIEAVRQVVPEDKLLIFRISDWGVADMEVSLFGDRSEYQAIISLLSDEPIDAISVSTYDYSLKAFGTDKNMAQLTREVSPLPILICGKIHDRASAEEALLDADIALSGKSALLNPTWFEDVRTGKAMAAFTSEEANIAYTETPLP